MELDKLRAAYVGRMIVGDDAAPFLTDWRKTYMGRARAVVIPETAADVAEIVRWCAAHRVPIVPQGGNTGLSGGAIPDMRGDAILLSLTGLNRVRAIEPVNNTITVEAGCLLASVRAAATQVDRLFPLSLAAEGSCTIGGNLATNAGGTAVLRYGSMRQLCLGIEAVMADGHIWNGLRALQKDNSGYALRDLLIGSEGTLAIITAAVLRLFPPPRFRATAFVSISDPAQAIALFGKVQGSLDARLTGFELISGPALDQVLRHIPDTRRPVASAPFYLLIETGDPANDPRELLEHLLAMALENGAVIDATIAESEAHMQAFWRMRESIGEAQSADGPVLKHDISVPISQIPELIATADAALSQHACLKSAPFGHVGDGNLHFNYSPTPDADLAEFRALMPQVTQVVHDLVTALGGSISAEHGVGVMHRDEMARRRPTAETQMLRQIKAALDPHGILNPGKVIE